MKLLTAISTTDALAQDKSGKLVEDGFHWRDDEGVPAVWPFIPEHRDFHDNRVRLFSLNPVGIFNSMNGLISKLNE